MPVVRTPVKKRPLHVASLSRTRRVFGIVTETVLASQLFSYRAKCNIKILLFGIVAYRALPVNDLPNIDYPTIQVTAALPGANPETMASSVATPLERQFSTIAGIESMNSTNGLGFTNITVQFALSSNAGLSARPVETASTMTAAVSRVSHILRSTDFPEMKFNQFLLKPYFGPGLLPHEQTLWIDELAVGTARLELATGTDPEK